MNDAILQLEAGNLDAAVEAALALVKTNPTNATARTFLFELCCFSGNWERAAKQLEVLGHQDVNATIGSVIYQQNLKAERDRINLFDQGIRPQSAMMLPKYADNLLTAADLLRGGDSAAARTMLDSVEEDRPAFACSINGEDFGDFTDYNSLTSCVFEVIIKDSYAWLPFEHAEKIEFLERKSLRDVYWLQAKVEWKNGTAGEVFFPSLYVNTWKNADDQIRLGKQVDWVEAGDDIYKGEGTRLFAVNGRDISILDINTIEFKHEKTD